MHPAEITKKWKVTQGLMEERKKNRFESIMEDWGYSSVLDHLLSMPEGLASLSNTTKKITTTTTKTGRKERNRK